MNPFEAKFSSMCTDCEMTVEEGDMMFSDSGDFICQDCADERDIICECGNYKKPDFEQCYECRQS